MKIDEAKVATQAPTLDELKACDDRARAHIGHPEVLSWRKDKDSPSYLLTVTYGSNSAPPTWILHAGGTDGAAAAVVWIAMTTETHEIMTKLKRAVHSTNSFSLSEAANKQQQVTNAAAANAAIVNAPVTPSAKDSVKKIELDDAPVTAVLAKGSIFAGLYEIVAQLGHGGMGIVYKAKRKDTGRLVGLKVLHPHLLQDTLSRARFEQEAQKSGLSHRNLIGIHKFGFSPEGQPFIAMDFLDGCPLTDLIAEGPMNLTLFTNIFFQVCEGLEHAHGKGVIHRDIKPGNIMICNRDGDHCIVKIVDFGIAKSNIQAGEDSRLTPTGEVLGSPLYMSPEQCAGGAPDPVSDIYSLGCVMYETLAGVPPFDHTNPIKLILMQISEKAPTLKESNPDRTYTKEQERIIHKTLEKNPSKRYQTAEELGRDIFQLPLAGASGTMRQFGGDLKKAAPTSTDGGSNSNNSNTTSAAEPVSYAISNPLAAAGLDLFSETASPSAEKRREAIPSAPIATTQRSEPKHMDTGELVDALKSAGKPKKQVTFRFRKFKTSADKDQIVLALDLSIRLLKKGGDLSIFLDHEAAHLAQRSDLMAPQFHTDLATTEKIQSIQTSFQKVVRAGGTIAVPEHWLRYFGILALADSMIPGMTKLDEDQMAEYMLERASSIVDYT